ETNDARPRLDANAEVESQQTNGISEIRAVAVRPIRKDDVSGDLGKSGSLDHPERQLDLRLEGYCFGDLCFGPSRWILSPRRRQIEFEVDGDLLVAGGHCNEQIPVDFELYLPT